ncbi:MAG TPA: glycosyltransferase family 4 protein [Puia sp.]|nr:glycosyltransferase family 4 protein [Puia sp.]
MATVISLVSYPFLPARVGGQRGIALFSKYFARYQKLICVTTKNNDPSSAEGYEVINILSDSALRYINFFYFFTLRRIIREKKATHLLLEHPYYGWLGILLKWVCRVKLIVHSHNIEALRWKTLGKWWWRLLWLYEKYTHRHADYNFFIHDADKQYGIDHFGLSASSCITMTYGIEWNSIPDAEEIRKARFQIRRRFQINEQDKILFFNGAFNHTPNLHALEKIIDIINPLLLEGGKVPYKIIICGRDIPAAILQSSHPNMIIAGFVENIDLFFKGSDLFINPVTEGGGIKTKLVEALGYNLNAVSTRSGAIGVSPDWCNGKLLLCEDDDWHSFARLIQEAAYLKADLPTVYFDHFYWGYSTQKAAQFIEPAKK